MSDRTMPIQLSDVAAADVIDALCGRHPVTEAEARRRHALADLLADALFTSLIRKDKP